MSGPSERRWKRPDLAERNRSGHGHPIFPMGEESGIKHCTGCCKDMPLAEFYPDKKSGGHRANCKACQKGAVMKSYYKDVVASRAKKTEYRSVKLAGRYAELDALKDVPCADCGGRFPAICMDFDHVRGEKIANISVMVHQRVAWELVLAEVEKCDVICSNCHRIRTAERGGWKRRVI